MALVNNVANQAADTFLKTCLGPWYEQRPDTFIVPYFSSHPNLASSAGGHTVFTPVPKPSDVKFGEKEDNLDKIGGKKRYLFVPPKVTVLIHYTSGGLNGSTRFSSGGIYDLATIVNVYGDNDILFDTMNGYTIDTSYDSWDDVRAEVCVGGSAYYLGDSAYVGLAPQGDACDAFYVDRCKDGSKFVNDLGCACIAENRELEKLYPNSQTQVTCLGRSCGMGGYKTRQMSKERCSVAYCSDFLLSEGNNLEYGNDTKIYCAGRSWRLKDQDNSESLEPIIATTIYEQADNRTTPDYLWIILAIALLVFGLLAYLVFR